MRQESRRWIDESGVLLHAIEASLNLDPAEGARRGLLYTTHTIALSGLKSLFCESRITPPKSQNLMRLHERITRLGWTLDVCLSDFALLNQYHVGAIHNLGMSDRVKDVETALAASKRIHEAIRSELDKQP